MKHKAFAAAVVTAACALMLAGWGRTYDWNLPADIAPPPIPADNPMSKVKVELGRLLFYDADLSVNGTLSCATCHGQHRGFAESNVTHPGVGDTLGRRNVMGLTNVGYLSPLTWADSSLTALEHQAMVPIAGDDPIEMGFHGQTQVLVDRLAKDACYKRLFRRAFPDEPAVSADNVGKALAAFERTLLSFSSPYDLETQRGRAEMTEAARRGSAIFKEVGCAGCHNGPAFSDSAFHRISALDGADRGLATLTAKAEDEQRFRTPGLRNVTTNAPYFHDGSAKTLEDAIARHDAVVQATTAPQTADLVAFLGDLTDQSFLENEDLSLPTRKCGRRR